MEDTQTIAGFARLPIETCFARAEATDAPAIITGTAVHWLRSIARRDACHLWHADPRRGPFQVDKSAVIRGRKLSVRLFISRYGAAYCTRWRVDGHSWTAQEVKQAFGF